MRTEIKELHQRLKTTTVYVTHDQIEAMTMADKIVVMNGGNVEQIGAPLELYDRPNNLFVAGFIGSPSMNFLKGKVEHGAFRAEGGETLPLPGGPNGSDGRPAVYGVRPEHFQLNPDGLPAKVHVVEPTGSETQVLADFAGASVLCAFRERVSAKPGETIRITPDTSLVHLFDAGTGLRLAG
jgi:multiple sugar transport system ATP-binding protein